MDSRIIRILWLLHANIFCKCNLTGRMPNFINIARVWLVPMVRCAGYWLLAVKLMRIFVLLIIRRRYVYVLWSLWACVVELKIIKLSQFGILKQAFLKSCYPM
ncbi:hypothetical protein KP509_23G059800 [Ceratopteris richardii]|uniref:Uncharacterized protein n=1 Tax=Ceratopteris richardii TaxID=49495 RepID=A0A8T2S0A0_CERRI|nr:hypothetical protein KP509_23G059800 [Ceratopteris richardii]